NRLQAKQWQGCPALRPVSVQPIIVEAPERVACSEMSDFVIGSAFPQRRRHRQDKKARQQSGDEKCLPRNASKSCLNLGHSEPHLIILALANGRWLPPEFL